MPENHRKLIRITTVPNSLGGLLRGQLRFMSQYFEVVGISSPGEGRLAEVGIQEGIKTYPVEMTRKITPINDLKALWTLYKIFKSEKPDIVHTHTPKAGTLGMMAAYIAGVPHRLHTIAGLPLMEATGLKRLILDFVEKLTYGCATHVYPNSFGLHKFVEEQKYAKPRKFSVIGHGSSNGIDINYFDPKLYDEDFKANFRRSLNIEPNDFVFVFVGRIVKDKGVQELVESFIDTRKQFHDIKLILVGGHEKQLDPISLETEQNIESNDSIISVGWQADVRPFFAISNALAFPSYREGFPNVVMQACTMGIPSIVSDINGCNELIRHNKNGLIVPVKDVEALTKAMAELITTKIEESPEEIRKFMIDNFSREYVHQEILNCYNDLFVK
ncbi:glycosyltransferase family 4 protein [Flagellimonas beolgyonensis]|uniref:glycosyltransferase family 4 protein n=1 Tax=Flagellimonas beolgyonensis TaxID=864064 RepID=UPI003D6587E2